MADTPDFNPSYVGLRRDILRILPESPAGTGAGLRILSEDAPLPNFVESVGIHPLEAIQK